MGAPLEGRGLAQEDAKVSREIQPLNEESRRLDPVYLPGKQGGQYMMEMREGSKWVVRGKVVSGDAEETPYQRIGAWERPVAQQVLNYAVEHDVSFRAALQDLYFRGEPDLLMELVEKAKAEPTYRVRRAKWDFRAEFSYRDGLDVTRWPAEIDAMIKNFLFEKGVERINVL